MRYGSVRMPSPAVIELADRVETLARSVARADPEDVDARRLMRSLAMWSVTIRRLAESGPAALIAGESGFGAPDTPSEADVMAPYRAHADAIAFLSIGDMVLDDFAALQLGRWHRPTGDVPWTTYMGRVDDMFDEEGVNGVHWDLIRASRSLDLVLREARNRLVAHRVHDHHLLTTWDQDAALEITISDIEVDQSAIHSLALIDQGARSTGEDLAPPSGGYSREDFWRIRDRLLGRAGMLGSGERRQLKSAFRSIGYDSARVSTVVGTMQSMAEALTT